MITLNLDWREVLWWLQGGMSGSHLRWNVYEDMVNRVWPQADEQERRNLWLIMRRDLGTWWRPDGWNGLSHMKDNGEGIWKADDNGMAIDHNDADGKPVQVIHDLTPWMYFRQVLARFDPDNQFAVTMRVSNSEQSDGILRLTPAASIIKQPSLAHIRKSDKWESNTTTVTVRAYRWQGEYRIDWSRRCAEDAIVKAEQMVIPDTEVM